MFAKLVKKISINKIGNYLKNQGIKNIDKCKEEEELLKKTKEYYKNIKYKNVTVKEVALKDKLILLDNEKNKINDISYLTEISLIITITLTIFSNMFGIMGKIEDIVSVNKNESIAGKLQIEKYDDNIEEARYKLGVYDDTNEYYNKIIDNNTKRKNDFIDNFEKNSNDEKEDIKKYSLITNIIFALFIFLVVIISYGVLVSKPIKLLNNSSRNIAINIHKSVIEEILNELEENKKQQEKEVQIENDIEDLKEKISEYKYKTELLEDIIKVNTNN